MSAKQRPVLLISEVLEILPIERSSLYRLFRSGRLRCVKLGGKTVIRRTDLDTFLATLPPADLRRVEVGA